MKPQISWPPGPENEDGSEGHRSRGEKNKPNQNRRRENTRPQTTGQAVLQLGSESFSPSEARCCGCGILLYTRATKRLCATCLAWAKHRRNIVAAAVALRRMR